MADTLSIRLREKDRCTLEKAAEQQGMGLSSLVRHLAEAEAKRLRNEEIRRGFVEIVEYLRTHPEAQAELDEYGNAGVDDWPPY